MNDISKRTCWVDMKQVGDRRRGLKAEGKKMPTVSAGYRLGIAGYSMQLFITTNAHLVFRYSPQDCD